MDLFYYFGTFDEYFFIQDSLEPFYLSFDVWFISIGAVSTSDRYVKVDQLSIDIPKLRRPSWYFRPTTTVA